MQIKLCNITFIFILFHYSISVPMIYQMLRLQSLSTNSCLKGVYPTNLLLNIFRMAGLSLDRLCRISQFFSKITSFFHRKLLQTQAWDQMTCNKQTEITEEFSGQQNKTPSIPFINSIKPSMCKHKISYSVQRLLQKYPSYFIILAHDNRGRWWWCDSRD